MEAVAKELNEELPSKRTKLEEQFKHPSDYEKEIVHIEGIHNHRFTSHLHISLQVEMFGEFIDAIESEECIDSKYYIAASALMQHMSGVFKNEQESSVHIPKNSTTHFFKFPFFGHCEIYSNKESSHLGHTIIGIM